MWYVVCTQHQKEFAAAAEIDRQDGFSTFLPYYEIDDKRARRRRPLRAKLAKKKKPLYPGYLFVEIDRDTSWRPLAGTRYVSHIICQDGEPVPVPADQMVIVKDVVAATAKAKTDAPPKFAAGMVARIIEGVLQGYNAQIIRQTGGRVRVSVENMPDIELPESALEISK